MTLAIQGPRFSTFDKSFSAIRRVRRRSSCPSLPQSVSVSSLSFDLSSEDLRNPADLGELEVYMSPLFSGHGLGGNGDPLDEAAERVSVAHTTTSTEGFTLEENANQCDDGPFERLSGFVITDEEDIPAPPESASDASLQEWSSTRTAPNLPLPVVQRVPLNTNWSKPPLSRTSSPTLAHPLPPVSATMARPMIPPPTTRPLRIDRSKTHQEASSAPQRAPRAGVQYERHPPRPILRSTTQVNLRDAYRRAGLAERRAHPKLAMPTIPPPPHAHPETPTPSAREVMNNH